MIELNRHFSDNTDVINNVLIFPESFKENLEAFLPVDSDNLVIKSTSSSVEKYKKESQELKSLPSINTRRS